METQLVHLQSIKSHQAHKGLIIYPPNQLMEIETPRPDGSLGPLYLAAALEKQGIPTDLLDASVGPPGVSLEKTFYRLVKQANGLIKIGMDFDEIAEYVVKGGYTFVGLNSNFTPQTNMAFRTAAAIKKANPQIKVFAGGVNARSLYERFLKTGNFDAICLTEGELILPRLLKEDPHGIAGVAFLDQNKNIVINHPDITCFPQELDELPMPAWEKLPFEVYESLTASAHGTDMTGAQKIERYAPIMTSRGCIWRCKYCHISKEKDDIGKYRVHSIQRVVQEVDKLKSLGVKKIFFEDDSLLAKKERARELFQKIKDKGLTIMNVNGMNLIDYFDRTQPLVDGKWVIDVPFLQLLKDTGFKQIVFPVESGNQRILNVYASGKVQHDKMDLLALMRTMRSMGIMAPVNMMIGFPDETEEEIQTSIEFGKKLAEAGAPYVTFFVPIPFPGSQLYDIALEGGYLDKNFDPDMMNWKHPVMKNTIVPPEKLARIRDEANDYVNNKEFIAQAIKRTAGYRWRSNKD